MTYTTEPGIFKLELLNKIHLRKFLLGDFNNWSEDFNSDKNYIVSMKVQCKDFEIPESWDFRKGWYFLKDSVWYYSRLVGPVHLKYRYDQESGEFIFYPRVLEKIPFIYNAFYPLGTEISNIFIYQMLKMGYVALKASAFHYKGKVILLVAPSYNGKTTLVRDIVDSESASKAFISEEMVFLSKEDIIGIPPCNWAWRNSNKGFKLRPNEMDLKVSKPDYVIYYRVSSEDKFFLCKSFEEFPALESYFYFSESMVSSMMYYEGKVKSYDLLSIYNSVLSKSSVYQVSTDGYNSKKFFQYLNEIVKK